jgi:CheY-like chemotaxis protein
MAEDKGKKLVMVVENDALIMQLVTDILELNSYRVMAYSDGPSALDALEIVTPSLVLLDIGLPEMDGFEVLKRIRADKNLSHVKVVAISASAMKEEEDKIHAAGFDGFIAKPMVLNNFVKRMVDYIQ